MGNKKNGRSVPAAYRSLMACFNDNPSREETAMERQGREWIWEFVLKHCSDLRVIKALVEAYPIPNDSVRLKRILLLKALSFDLLQDTISERTLDTICAIMELNKSDGKADDVGDCDGMCTFHNIECHEQDGVREEGRCSDATYGRLNSKNVCFSVRDIYVAVMVECTIRHLREEADNWPKFYDALEKHWGDCIQDTEEREDEGDSPSTVQLRKELWEVQKQPELRHALLQKYKRPSVMKMLQVFVTEAWRGTGLTFLEGVADNLLKGVYVPSGQMNVPQRRETNMFKKDKLKGALDGTRDCAQVALEILGKQNDEQQLLPLGPLQSRCSDRMMNGRGSVETPNDVLETKVRGEKMAGGEDYNAQKTRAKKERKGKRGMKFSEGCEQEEKEENVGNFQCETFLKRPAVEASFRDKDASLRRSIETKEDLAGNGSKMASKVEVNKNGTHTELLRREGIDQDLTEQHIIENIGKDKDQDGPIQHELEYPLQTGRRKDSVGPSSNAELLMQGEEPNSLSPPPWAGSPGLLSRTLTVTTRSKRRKLGYLLHDEGNSSKLVQPVGSSFQGDAVVETPEILKAKLDLKESQAHLNAAVNDPLPEALKIAEAAAISRENGALFSKSKPVEEQLPTDGSNQVISSTVQNISRVHCPQLDTIKVSEPHDEEQRDVAAGGSGIGPLDGVKRTKGSLMDRNPTAQTYEWETNDEITESPEDNSPSSSRRIRLPGLGTRHLSPLRGRQGKHGGPKRRRHNKWTQEEEDILKKEVARYGKGRWKYILEKNTTIFENRTEVDLKDKWRNIERREGIL